MPRKSYDPLAVIPSPDAIRERLTATLTERLRILLELAERLRLPLVSASDLSAPQTTEAKGGRANG